MSHVGRARLGDFTRTGRQVIGRGIDNQAGCGILAYKNQAHTIQLELERQLARYCGVEQFRLIFDPRSVILSHPEEETAFEHARFISRAFRNAQCHSLVISGEALWRTESRVALRSMLELGEEEKVLELRGLLDNLPQGITVQVLSSGPAAALFPGEFKHYTDRAGFDGILESDHITATERFKGGKKGFFVSVSRLSLSPKDVADCLFSIGEMQAIPGRGEYVVAFDLKNGLPQVCHLCSDRSLEGWIEGNLYLSEVNLTYSGPNQLDY